MKNDAIKYVFDTREPELRRLVVKYGQPPARNKEDLWKKTNGLIAQFKHEMLKDIADIHPDKDLIIWAYLQDVKKESPAITPTISTKPVIQETDSKKFSNVDGEKKSIADVIKGNLPLVVIGSLIVVGGLIFLGSRTK